jgi:hypothetical protein
MGLLDNYFDPQQFQDSGGLVGRLLSLQGQQEQYQPGVGFDLQGSMGAQAASAPSTPPTMPAISPTSPNGAPTSLAPQTSGDGPTRNIAIGDYQMPQFGKADISQAAPQPLDLGDRLSAGFQSWAHTPVGNPFAAIANGFAGFNAGQRTNAAGVVPAQTPQQGSGQPPDLGDRLSAGFQNWAHTPAGNPIAGIANGIAGLNSGQRTEPAGIAQRMLQPQAGASGNAPQDVHSQYQALRPLLGDRDAMLAVVNPEMGQTLIAQALARQKIAASPDESAGNDQPSVIGPSNLAGDDQPARSSVAAPAFRPSGYAATATTGRTARGNPTAALPRKPKSNFRRSTTNGQ